MEDLSAGLKVIRQHLHQYPEVSGNEYETYKYLYNLLERVYADRIETVADTGLLVTFKGRSPGKNILFRGDTDALPIHEVNNIEYRSVTDGVAHKCGHDGHSTIMYGLCRFYGQNRPDEGDVYILFQPAEENGRGARGVVDSGGLDDKEINFVFALHNVPSYPLNTIVCREGSFTPGVTTLIAYFEGHTAHAAEPWKINTPAAITTSSLGWRSWGRRPCATALMRTPAARFTPMSSGPVHHQPLFLRRGLVTAARPCSAMTQTLPRRLAVGHRPDGLVTPMS